LKIDVVLSRAGSNPVELLAAFINSEITYMIDQRETELAYWTTTALVAHLSSAGLDLNLKIVSGDASFRRYYRVEASGQNFIAVDAPPENENSHAFVAIAQLFAEAGVTVPRVINVDYQQGFMLLEDFGDELYLSALLQCQENPGVDSNSRIDSLYRSAITALVKLQSNVQTKTLAPYDRNLLHNEMALFEEWFCGAFLAMALSAEERKLIASTLKFLEDEALAQPVVAVHKDYHSRNLMTLDSGDYAEGAAPGIIDFQDAVAGPYTYDLVSLLRDCYVQWPSEQLASWALDYLSMAQQQGVVADIDRETFFRHFDMMGLQRNLKVIGIFSRLCIRDKKPGYLADIPLVIHYFLDVGSRYVELGDFVNWFRQDLLPEAGKHLVLDSLCEQ
jgi:hypothetical protein|tara:strand:+ start:110 stop:1279 length:1170 start_codon:yes stop_codon:yes gene_type:complete